MNKKIKKLALTISLIELLHNDYALAKSNGYTNIFNEENGLSNQYGASQRAFDYHFNELIKDELIWNEIQKYFPLKKFESYDEAEFFYKKYFNIISDCGCGYVAIANSIFNYFDGREDDFLKTFGFPMYTLYDDNTIDYNYELLVLKIFNYSIIDVKNNNYSIVDIVKYFEKDFYTEKLRLFLNSSEYRKKLPDNFAKFTKDDWEKWHLYEVQREKKFKYLFDKWQSSQNIYKNLGVSLDPHFADIKSFLNQYNISVDIILQESNKYNQDDIIACDNFSLYQVDENDNIIHKIDHVEAHYIFVTGFSDDGKVIVSSWGKKYFFDDTDCNWVYKLTLQYQ